ncbi:MAG: hypothetical protein HKO92_00925 [Flavobacteriaceae bacterium]|nr:hypothetical protein [Flavobacteriaceae bacterium]
MLGLLLIFFIGKYFYELAQDYYKHRWLYAILGIVTYYASGAIFGVILSVFDFILELNINWDDSFGVNLLGIPIGLAGCYIFYIMLKNRWEKEDLKSKDEIDDIGKITE